MHDLIKPVLVIRTGRAPNPIRARHGDFPHWLRLGTRLQPQQIQVIDVAFGEHLPAPHELAGAIITGSAAMVTERAPWSEQTAEWIRQAMAIELPLFGVCYGHQLMAHALGGRVDYLPGGREIGTVPINFLGDPSLVPLTSGLPETFRAHTTHEQAVLEPPPDASVLARSGRDPHQMLRYGRHAFSTQFHPEFSADVMRAYIRRKRTDMHRENTDPSLTFSAVAATPVARSLLRRFAELHLAPQR